MAKIGEILRQDVDQMEQEFGVEIYDPNAQSLEFRFPNKLKQRFFVTSEEWNYRNGYESYSSGSMLSGDLLVNVTEVVPGRIDYKSNSIYKAGDLRKAFLANSELMGRYKARVVQNKHALISSPEIRRFRLRSFDWIQMAEQLRRF
jgi:hypothetical protein